MQSKSKLFFIAIAIILIALMVWYLKTIVFYIIISIVLSLIGQPLVQLFSKIRIKNFRLPASLCTILSLFSMLAVIAALFSLFIPLIAEEVRIVNKINPNEVVATFQEPLKSLESILQKYQTGYDSGESIEKYLAEKLSSVLGFNEISTYAQQLVGFMGSIIAAFFSISFITFFFMKDEHLIYNSILLLTPPKHTERVKDIMRDTKYILTRYFIGVLLDMAFVASLTSIGLSILGLENAMLIGLFAGILNVIPYVGPLLGVGFALIIGVSGNLDLNFYSEMIPLMEKIALIFLIVQLIDSLFFQPIVISNRVKAHPLEIFLVILIAAKIGGIIGMVAAIPIYTIIRIIAKEFFYNFKIVQKLTEDLEEEC
ncbi:MAG: hypothetical protein A3F72_16985 [Bacteroidetes bacterium RIFCSPLOWO2_12_FULL_35_15]|nr:MAG: hypothetical protein A3F72_16985 [Bacteroidetes bacterium RIFCSPLOWO2_12_FULL_35_15]